MNKYKKFLSIDKDASKSFIENKSTFIGYAFYVETKEDAENKILMIKEKHKDATHNCFAYIIGEEKLIQKYSDDGEPKGTAGAPILEVLKKRDVTNCLVVVTRYFGGILLGAKGLIRAYTNGAVIAIDEAKIVCKEPFYLLKIILDYTNFGKAEYIIKNLNLEIIKIEYLEKVNIKLFVKVLDFEGFKNKLIDETSNNCILSIEDEILKSVM